jgi:two-component system cell cycle sensor histidine kinase/response regulator CckA
MNERILIVEDEAILALDLEQRLTGMGFVVVDTASTGADAIEMAGRHRPDLVLMDIRLRGEMDGTEAAREIRSRFGLPVIFVTAFSDAVTVGRAKLAEPFGYVLKPFENREISLAIELALYKHQSEEKLRGVERWLAATLNSVGDAVVTLDLNGIVTFMNPAAQKMTGRIAAESLGRHFEEVVTIIDENSGEPVKNPAYRTLREGVVVGLEEAERPDNGAWRSDFDS